MKNIRILRLLAFAQLLLIIFLTALVYIQCKNSQVATTNVVVEYCATAQIDQAIWQGAITVRHSDLVQASELLDRNRSRTLRNFTAKGITQESVVFLPVQTQSDSNGYVLVQHVEVKTTDFERLDRVAKESDELLKFKVDFSSNEPRFRIANFTTWLIEQIPELLMNARKQALALAGRDKEIVRIKHFKLYPVTAINYRQCQNANLSNDAAGLQITLTLEAEFVVR